MPYLARHAATDITEALANFPCVFINGPRQSGKTTLSRLVWPAGEATYVNFDDTATLAVASAAPESFLSGYAGKLILDEIQLVPSLYRALKARIDSKRAEQGGSLKGAYLLTGSTNILALPQLADALVGRMIIKTLYPLSAAEAYGAKSDFLSQLRGGSFSAGTVPPYDLVEAMQKATFPEIHAMPHFAQMDWLRSYLTTLIQRDVQHIMHIEKTTLLPQLLRLIAARVGGLLNEADLARQVKENAVTTKRYRTILDLLFLTVLVPAWSKNVGKRVVKSPKIYLIDTNLTCHLTGAALRDVALSDPTHFGHLVENFVATELLKQIGQPIHQAGLHHFRTSEGREVDFVIEYPDQKLVGVEVKAKDTITKQDCAGLLELAAVSGKDFLRGCILYRGQQILKVSDSIWALPISMLWNAG